MGWTAEDRRDYTKKRRAKARRNGMCPYHPNRNAAPGKTLCPACLDYKSGYEKTQRDIKFPPEDADKCGICLRGAVEFVHEDRQDGQTRGRICASCSTALGFFRDDLKVVKRAVAYLRCFSKANGTMSTESTGSSTTEN